MILKRNVFSFAMFAALALGLGTNTLAADVQVKILPNTAADSLTASLEETSRMDVVAFSGTSEPSTGVLVLNVTDGRGSNTGWNVTIRAGDFSAVSGNAALIPARGFRVTSDAGIRADVGSADGIEVLNSGVPLNNGTRILSAEEGFGTGKFTQQLEVALDIPAWQPVGTYEANMTVTIASGPGT